jgi:predicted amidohydrolase
VLLPETCASGFSRDVPAATARSPEMEAGLAALAKRFSIALMAGLAVQAGSCGANESVTFGPDGTVLCRYRKLQPFTGAGEETAYPAGDKVVTFPWGGFTVAPFICYDLRFPVWARQQPEINGDPEYDIIVYVANWPEKRIHAWKTLLQARAIENQCFVIGVNRVGDDGNNIHYSGDSMVVDPMGEILYTKNDQEDIFTITLERSRLDDVREKFPFWKDADKFNLLM